MSQSHDPTESLLAAASRIEAPASLRARTLARASEAWAQPAPPDLWRQVWESRPLRLAWATAAAALAVANLVLPPRPSLRAPLLQPSVAAQGRASDELREVVSLPRLKAAYAAIDPGGGQPLRPERQHLVPNQPSKENPS
jgi:hypothetical protein